MRLRIRELRDERGMTADALAKAIGRSQGFVSLIENGKKNPSPATLLALSHAFGVSVAELFDAGDMNADIAEMVGIMRDLTPEDRRSLLRAASGFVTRLK